MAQRMIGGEPFEVVVEGKARAPAILFSNSLGTDLSMWDAQVKALKGKYRIIRYDSRGHGKSTLARAPYSIAQLGADALAILDDLKIAKAHFCGLSKGGMVGQWLAAHHGDRLGKVVLANTAARMGPPDLWNTRIATVRGHGLEAIVDATMDRWFGKEFQARNPAIVARVRAMFMATPREGYAACCTAIRDMDQTDTIRRIRNEVLVIVGKNDPATPPQAGKLIKDSIKGAKLRSLATAHLSAVEKPAEFTRILETFLEG